MTMITTDDIRISGALGSEDEWAKNVIDTYAKDASFTPSHTRHTHRVPNSVAMPIEEAQVLFSKRLIDYEDAVNDFLDSHNVKLEQHQFDALVSFTYQMGQNTWTLPDRLEWNINKLIRNGPPFDPEMARIAFTNFYQSEGRRTREFEVFMNGY